MTADSILTLGVGVVDVIGGGTVLVAVEVAALVVGGFVFVVVAGVLLASVVFGAVVTVGVVLAVGAVVVVNVVARVVVTDDTGGITQEETRMSRAAMQKNRIRGRDKGLLDFTNEF